MSIALNRRKFLGASAFFAAATGTQVKADTFMSWLSQDGAVTKVFNMLQKNLGLKNEAAEIIPAFIERLKKNGHEPAERFTHFLLDPRAARELEAYVVEEFVVNTNFLFVRAGQATRYKLL